MGALQIFLKNSNKYRSVSAFCPIANPLNCQWGTTAFQNYLGSVEAGASYDPTHLVKDFSGPAHTKILIDQGTHDKFLKDQLLPCNFLDAAHKAGVEVEFNMREGYSHDFWFVSSFMEDHIEFHARYLKI